jgi:hypothetical protein
LETSFITGGIITKRIKIIIVKTIKIDKTFETIRLIFLEFKNVVIIEKRYEKITVRNISKKFVLNL